MVLLEEPTFPHIDKELEPGKGTDVRGWQNCAAAEEVIGLALVRVGRSTRRLHGGR